jgi:hypothetical protein
MQHSIRTITSWVPYPAVFVPAGYALKCSHAPLAPRMAHSDQHGDSISPDGGRRACRHASPQNLWPGCSYRAAGARPFSIPARAAALMLRQDATGLRALGLKPASLLRTAPASLPAPRSRRAPAGQGQSQKRRGAQDGASKRCERSLSVRNVCASAAAPDWPPFLRFAQSYQSASRARFALNRPRSLGNARKEGANRQIKTRLAGVRSQRRVLISLRRWGGCARWLRKRAGDRSLGLDRRSASCAAPGFKVARLPKSKLRSGCERSPENTQLAGQTLINRASNIFFDHLQRSPNLTQRSTKYYASH